jgi:tetratricopeptide (TPR) repeat protein
VPTFSFGVSYWDTPTYYAAPAVVYTQPTVVVETPEYGGTTYYSQPAPTYYADSGTTYVESQVYPAPSVEGSGSTYVERQYAVPTAPPTTAPPVQQPAPQQEAPAKQPDQRVLATVGKGNEQFGAGRYADARRSYGEAIAIDDTDGIAELLYGLASFAEGDFTTASVSTRRAMEATPDLVYYPFNIKALYRDQMKFQEHIAALARHSDAQPGDQDAQFLLGYMWYASGDAQNARTIFGGLATNNPDEKLYSALRDASGEALESLSKQPPQSATTQSAP